MGKMMQIFKNRYFQLIISMFEYAMTLITSKSEIYGIDFKSFPLIAFFKIKILANFGDCLMTRTRFHHSKSLLIRNKLPHFVMIIFKTNARRENNF